MKKIMILILSLFILIGCTQTDKDVESPFNGKKDTALEALIFDDYIIAKIAEYKNILIIQYIAIEESRPSKLMTVDKEDYSIRHEIENQIIGLDGFDIITKEAGFYINNGPIVTLYDYDLNVINEIDIEKLQNKKATSLIWKDPFSLSDDFKKITYVDYQTRQLMVYDFETQMEREIYQLSENVDNILWFYYLYLTEDYIGFAGAYNHEGYPDILNTNVFGRIHLESKEPELHFTSEVSVKALDHYMILIDDIRSDKEYTGTGFTSIYDIKTHLVHDIELIDSYNSFDVSILSHNMVVSYNDLSGNDTKFILYDEGVVREIDNILPKDTHILVVGNLYVSDRESIIVYYTIATEDLVYEQHIREIDIK